jgi:hypothetical protein
MNPRDLRRPPQPVPKGWLTSLQWAKRWGLSASHTRRLITEGLAAGKVQHRAFRIRSRNGVYPVPHYRAR